MSSEFRGEMWESSGGGGKALEAVLALIGKWGRPVCLILRVPTGAQRGQPRWPEPSTAAQSLLKTSSLFPALSML